MTIRIKSRCQGVLVTVRVMPRRMEVGDPKWLVAFLDSR